MNHIHTIPVLDALRNPEGCAFCAMYEKLNQDSILFIMGPAYMEDDVRMETNKIGFCPAHLKDMYKEQNRLGLGLMLHTYMHQLNKDLDAIIKNRVPASIFKKDTNSPLTKIKTHLEQTINSCYVCNKIERTFDRYIDTFLYLWAKGGSELDLIESQPGYCLPHFTRLLNAADSMSKSKKERFLSVIVAAQKRLLEEMELDLEWFTLKFDHRNADAPWKNAKDALPRAINLLSERK